METITENIITKTEEIFISSAYINETLNIYNDEYIYLESAIWENSSKKLMGKFNMVSNPLMRDIFKDVHGEHLGAPFLMIYLVQLGYLYTRMLFENELIPSKYKSGREEFFRLRDTAKIVFTNFMEIEFLRIINTSESPIEIVLEPTRSVSIKNTVINELNFTVQKGAHKGRFRAAFLELKNIF